MELEQNSSQLAAAGLDSTGTPEGGGLEGTLAVNTGCMGNTRLVSLPLPDFENYY